MRVSLVFPSLSRCVSSQTKRGQRHFSLRQAQGVLSGYFLLLLKTKESNNRFFHNFSHKSVKIFVEKLQFCLILSSANIMRKLLQDFPARAVSAVASQTAQQPGVSICPCRHYINPLCWRLPLEFLDRIYGIKNPIYTCF